MTIDDVVGIRAASYWQTSEPSSGASASAGKRRLRNARAASIPAGVASRAPFVGSKIGPGVSSASLKPRFALPGIPYIRRSP